MNPGGQRRFILGLSLVLASLFLVQNVSFAGRAIEEALVQKSNTEQAETFARQYKLYAAVGLSQEEFLLFIEKRIMYNDKLIATFQQSSAANISVCFLNKEILQRMGFKGPVVRNGIIYIPTELNDELIIDFMLGTE